MFCLICILFAAGVRPETSCRLAGVLLARADYAQLLHCPDLSDGTWHEVPLPQAHDKQTCNNGACAALSCYVGAEGCQDI